MDASEIYSKRPNAKEVIFPKEKGEFIFPIADGRIKTLGGDQDLRTSTSIRQRPIQGESHPDFLGESEGSLPPLHDSLPDAGEAINNFWSVSEKLHIPPLLEEKPPEGCMWSGGGRLTRKLLTSRPDHLWPELWEKMGKNAKLKEKQKWSHEKLHLDNARKLRGIYFIDPENKEVKKTIKNARKKLETPVDSDMPCKIIKSNKNCGTGASNKIKTKLAYLIELLL